jgi:hypothetical protein
MSTGILSQVVVVRLSVYCVRILLSASADHGRTFEKKWTRMFLSRVVDRAGDPVPARRSCGGALAPACAVFDTWPPDYVTLPDGSRHGGSDCPAGAVLPHGGAVGWHSDGNYQGNHGGSVAVAATRFNICGESNRGPCGLPYSRVGIGGGWEICFAA